MSLIPGSVGYIFISHSHHDIFNVMHNVNAVTLNKTSINLTWACFLGISQKMTAVSQLLKQSMRYFKK